MQAELQSLDLAQSNTSALPRLCEVHRRLGRLAITPPVSGAPQKLDALERNMDELRHSGDLSGAAEVWEKIIVLRHHLAARGVLR
jgi:hypothetical protein